MMQTPHQQVRI
jgi:hypothetical protein